MEVRRTVPVKLDVADSDANLLHETISEFLWAANYVVDYAWQGEYKTTSKAELQRETYHDVRAETRLQANLVQNARNKAADAVQSVVARWKQGDYAGKPHFSAPTLVYDKRCATFNDDHATLSTVEGRITAEYVLPDENRDTPHSEYLLNDDYAVTGAELHYRDGEFYLHVRTKADVESETADEGNGGHRTVLGVDLGIETVAVTSTGTFWNGSELNHWHREFEKRRGSLQQRGTRAAHETIQSVGRTETGRYDHFLHTVSKQLVAEAVENGCDVIAFENLTGIRERMPRAKKFHAWAFRRLFAYVEYKAEVVEISVEQVSPAYTSQRCSKCGFTHQDNRPSSDGQDVFECVNYPALLAPSGLAALGHSLRAGLYRNDIVPRDPVHGRGPASYYRPRAGQRVGVVAATRAYRTRSVECPADLILGVLALYPNEGTERPVASRSRSSFPSIGCDGDAVAPQEPVYSWLLPTSTCARTAVPHRTRRVVKTGRHTVKVNEDGRSSPPFRSDIRPTSTTGAPRPAPLLLKCGYSPHADYNAAKNIGLKHLRAAQKSSGGGAPVNVRLNRGTLNVNGEYVPAVSDGQNGSPRESPTLNEANGEAVSE